MAAVEPYSPCPCGSGQKFKWCCQKVEAQAERAQRLFESGQVEAAIGSLDEGLRKDPGNAWLLTRKALYQVRMNQVEPAKATLRQVLEKQPKHLGALILLTRLTLETEGPGAGAAQFQQVLTAAPAEGRPMLAGLARVVGVMLSQAGLYAASLKHLALVPSLVGNDDDTTSSVRLIEGSATVPAWQKNPYELSPPPEGLSDSSRERFAQALAWAGGGLWSAAASAFEVLSADDRAASAADRNLGLCRLWLADNASAAAALRRHIARLGATDEAVDLEALCQQVAPPRGPDRVEQVQLIWPLRDRDGLLGTLREDGSIDELGPGPIDPDDPDSPEVEQFDMLDRPRPKEAAGLKVEDIPRVVGRVLVGREIVALETYDDGRLDGLSDRFTALAGTAIPPAHPKTKVLAKVSRTALALSWEWRLPEGLSDDDARRLTREQGARMVRDVWPQTPLPFLNGRTPLQAAQDGDAAVPLRAALMQLEQSHEPGRDEVDFAALRARLNLAPEPPIDPEAADIERVHLARLALVPVDRLDDARLAALYRRARRYALFDVVERAARALIDRPGAIEREKIESLAIYSDLAMIAVGRGAGPEAFEWIRRGQQAEPATSRAATAPTWDMIEVRIRTRTEPPETWVPELAVVLERYGNDPQANETIMLSLVDMGLVRLVPNPDRPDDLMIDTRPLQVLFAEYGPRVTTATGRLGVAATRPEIWTPGGPSGAGGGGLWTPGAEAGSPSEGGDKPKLIIPGR
jgi:tetratricopeptide (TPR) repeat protein